MVKKALAGALVALGVAALGLAAACNGILGIDAATVDPTLSSDGGTGNGAVTCSGYCATIAKNCVGINEEYTDIGTCEAMCNTFEPGVPDDTTQDSLACRNYHANAAAGDPDFHCRHAGPLGGFHCGTDPCVPFCSMTQALCGGMDPPPYDGGEIPCQAACRAYPYLVADDAGDITLTTGDTLNCRIYHLESAYEPNNPAAVITHCPHLAVVSATCHD